MCAQHGRQRKGRSASLAFGVVGGNEFDQRRPRHDLIHLLQKLAFAGFLDVQAQPEGCLFHDKRFSQIWLTAGTNFWELCRVSLKQNKKCLFTSGITHPLGLGPDIDSGICSWCQIVNAILFGKPNS